MKSADLARVFADDLVRKEYPLSRQFDSLRGIELVSHSIRHTSNTSFSCRNTYNPHILSSERMSWLQTQVLNPRTRSIEIFSILPYGNAEINYIDQFKTLTDFHTVTFSLCPHKSDIKRRSQVTIKVKKTSHS